MAVGCPLSHIFASVLLEEFQKKALSSSKLKQRIWWRYVDDTIIVFTHVNTEGNINHGVGIS
ncbi:hypothetical protein J6590_015514 [Homalodisca vitripennis]|nr:hypothetical protein J6590_015514 [Homalodisca vitripennis]